MDPQRTDRYKERQPPRADVMTPKRLEGQAARRALHGDIASYHSYHFDALDIPEAGPQIGSPRLIGKGVDRGDKRGRM